MCRLLETIRVESGAALWVEYHQRRVDRSIGDARVDLNAYIDRIDLPTVGCHKLRIVYCEQGIIEHTISPYQARSIESLQLVVDDQIVYDRKAEDRSAIDRLIGLRNGCGDIIVARDGLVTDSSFANIALFDGQQWVTPRSPLLEGTCRARLIERGILTAERVTVQSLFGYQKLLLINSMLDFDPSRALPISSVRR